MVKKTSVIRQRFGLALLIAMLFARAIAVAGPAGADDALRLALADTATDERELRKLRNDAQRDRREQRSLRNQRLSDAARTFRADAGNLEQAYRERARAIDTEFRLEEARLQAEMDAEVARLETLLQKQLSAALMGGADEQEMVRRMASMERETQAYQDRIFEARKQGAARVQAARIEAMLRQDAVFAEMDQRVLERARALGLDVAPEPIGAPPIGGEMTRQEEQWNAREQKEVTRLAERHAKLLAPYRNGAAIRAWEREILQEDFVLDWQERSELRSLQTQQAFFSQVMLQSAAGEAFDRDAYIDRLAENAEQQRLIRIRYEQTEKENAIRRREEKRALSSAVSR